MPELLHKLTHLLLADAISIQFNENLIELTYKMSEMRILQNL